MIGENLVMFLRTFRERAEWDRYLRIDQLCIDQHNTLEKDHQVKLMSRIYKKVSSH